MDALRGQRGQAAVELVAALPVLVAAALIGWQLVLAGHATWLSANAARVAARALVVGRDGGEAARSALPRALRRGVDVRPGPGGRVRVRVPLPLLVPRARARVALTATTKLADPR